MLYIYIIDDKYTGVFAQCGHVLFFIEAKIVLVTTVHRKSCKPAAGSCYMYKSARIFLCLATQDIHVVLHVLYMYFYLERVLWCRHTFARNHRPFISSSSVLLSLTQCCKLM